MVKLPYRSESNVIVPQVVRPHANGKIPRELLRPCGIRNFTMVEPAARACRAMVTAALADGVRLDASGTYRSYDEQLKMFTDRYITTPIEGRPTKTWNGVRYWLKPDNAGAATPGTSKHGLGLAPDLKQRSASGRLEDLDSTTLSWLAEHAPTFGFWNSVKSEDWHWPYFPGDDIPDAVLQMERNGMIRVQPDVPADPRTREAFYRELPFGEVLSKGSRGLGVEAVQWALTRAGFATDIDGDFGSVTDRTVQKFQSAKNRTVDGRVDEPTWGAVGLLSDRARPKENSAADPVTKSTSATKRKGTKRKGKKRAEPQHGAIAAAVAAYEAGFRGADLAQITMIAGRESGWKSDSINQRTSDRGMWQINWGNLQREPYTALRNELGIDDDMDLLDLEVNAAVAFWMQEDAIRSRKPWFPWRASDTGYKNHGPGWDPDGSHTWRTEQFAAEAKAAAKAVLDAGGRPADSPSAPAPEDSRPAKKGSSPGTYTIVGTDSDGISALVGRCLGIADEPWALRRAAAEAVAEHTGGSIDSVWHPGDTLRFPPTIDGVRFYTVQAGDGLIAIAKGLGLGGSAAARKRIAAINAWQGPTPHPDATWYGGAA